MRFGLGVITTAAFFGISAHLVWADSSANLRPTWLQDDRTIPVNASYFSCRQSMDLRPAWESKLFDRRFAANMRQEYEDRTRDYEMRQQYGLLDMTGVMAFNSTMTDMRHDLVNQMRQMQVQGYQQNMKTAAQNGEVSRPVMLTGSVTSFYMGNPVDVTFAPTARLWARADIPNQVGEVRFSNPYANTDVAVNASPNAQAGPNSIPSIDPTTGQPFERYKVSLSRLLPLWDLSSGVTYGGSSSTVRASVSKPIVGNLTGVVENVSPVTAVAAAAGAPNERTVRVVYGLNF